MRKVSVGILASGFAIQLLLSTRFFYSDSSCITAFISQSTVQNKIDKKQLQANEVVQQGNGFDDLSPLNKRSRMQASLPSRRDYLAPDSIDPERRAIDTHEKKQDHEDSAAKIFFYIFTFVLAGFIALTGLFMALFSRDKKPVKLHIYRIRENSLLNLRAACLTCGELIGHAIKTGKQTTQNHKLWVVQITLNAPTRRKYLLAIREMVLPVIRRENDFVVVGPYRQKQDAAQVLTCLSEQYGLRGWLIEGN